MEMSRRRLHAVGLLGVALAVSTALASCTGGSGDTGAAGGKPAVEPGAARPGSGDAGQEAATGSAPTGSAANRNASGALLQEQTLIQTSSLSVEVTDVTRAVRAAEDTALATGGRVQSEQMSSETGDGSGSDDRVASADLVLRVPPDAYERTVRELASLGRLLSQGRDTKDVTQQFVDVQSRIETQRASLDRVRVLLSRATKIGDVVAIESELSRRQADLESLLAQQKALAEQAGLGTIKLHLVATGDQPVAEGKETELGFLAGLRNGWRAFTGFGGVVLLVVGALLPFILAGVVVATVAFPLIRRLRQPRPAKAANADNAPLSS
jgi:Domain of unknown function (DUF4349)